ncbi:MAG: hypothetical protein AseanaTS_01770 [Candidatus Pelagadaptatus aseana]
MKIYLLTHAREVSKKTNTGQLALQVCPDVCERIVWDRVGPDPRLLSLSDDAVLLYPKTDALKDSTESVWADQVDGIETFIVIDSTWQEARKIYNRSPYLHHLKKYSLPENVSSSFRLRRNQKVNGLCTAEIVEFLLRATGRFDVADDLADEFQVLNRSGG